MIFITLGSQKFQFNRLLIAIDKLVETGMIKEKIFAQTGYSDYTPVNYEYKAFLDRNEFAQWEARADLIITHGGTGAIIGAVKNGKKVIAVPRRVEYGEHVDNHQCQIVRQFRDLDLICECDDCDKLKEAIKYCKSKNFKSYRSNTQAVISEIDKYIENI